MKWHAQSKILLQGVHHPLGAIYIEQMQRWGTQLVAGVSAGHGGEKIALLPVFDLIEEAIAEVGPVDLSVILSPPYRVLDASLEAIAAGIRQLVIVSAGVPSLDMIHLLRKARETQTFILGSGSQGLLIPEQFLVGTFDPDCYQAGNVGIISHCDSLTDDIAYQLTQAGIGQSLVVSLGTDGIIGSNFEQWLQTLEEDEQTNAIVLLGQPNSNGEMRAAEYVAAGIEKPVIAYLTGRYGTFDKQFGDSFSIIAHQLSHTVPELNSVQQTILAFEKAEIPIALNPWEIATYLEAILTTP
ncbi:MAG: succinate--CoA ligase subunit alpha [Microcystaceae cyanobacterium]